MRVTLMALHLDQSHVAHGMTGDQHRPFTHGKLFQTGQMLSGGIRRFEQAGHLVRTECHVPGMTQQLARRFIDKFPDIGRACADALGTLVYDDQAGKR